MKQVKITLAYMQPVSLFCILQRTSVYQVHFSITLSKMYTDAASPCWNKNWHQHRSVAMPISIHICTVCANGFVVSVFFVFPAVILCSLPNTPPIDEGTVLWTKTRSSIAQVYIAYTSWWVGRSQPVVVLMIYPWCACAARVTILIL